MVDHKLLVPAYKLTFSRDASAGGGAAVVLGPAASSGKVVDTTDEPKASTVVELRVELDMDVPADGLLLVMGQVGTFRPARGDAVKVELGYADDDRGLFHVLTGGVVGAEAGLVTRRLSANSAAEVLLAATANEHFVGKSAGELVKELASRAGVPVDTVEDGIQFPSYVVDGRRSIGRHLRDLAELCGFDLYVTPEGKLVFKQFVGGRTVHVFEYGRDILELELLDERPVAGKVRAFGESPGASQGENSWAWLTKDFSPQVGESGTGDRVRLLEHAALRTGTSASRAATAAFTHLRRHARRGRLLLTGQPQVALGDAVRIRKVPESALDGSYQVRAVTHVITKSSGFTTAIEFRSLES
jgi:phage protein D